MRRSCPLSSFPRGGPTERRGCAQWKPQLVRWLAANPQINTLFATQSAGTESRRSNFASEEAGYLDGFKMLPSSVKHIVVLRDNPRAAADTLDCVERAVAAGKPAGPACALPRSKTLLPDPLAAAAEKVGSPGVGVVDLTPFYCSATLCYEVIGGVLVHSDEHHITELFNLTLAPYLIRALDRGQWLNH